MQAVKVEFWLPDPVVHQIDEHVQVNDRVNQDLLHQFGLGLGALHIRRTLSRDLTLEQEV